MCFRVLDVMLKEERNGARCLVGGFVECDKKNIFSQRGKGSLNLSETKESEYQVVFITVVFRHTRYTSKQIEFPRYLAGGAPERTNSFRGFSLDSQYFTLAQSGY